MKLKRNNNIIIGTWTMSKKEAELMDSFNRSRQELFVRSHRTIMDIYNQHHAWRSYEIKR